MVEFLGKKSRRYFVGKVTENTKSSDEITINFMRRNNKCNFTFPIIKTRAIVARATLKNPPGARSATRTPFLKIKFPFIYL